MGCVDTQLMYSDPYTSRLTTGFFSEWWCPTLNAGVIVVTSVVSCPPIVLSTSQWFVGTRWGPGVPRIVGRVVVPAGALQFFVFVFPFSLGVFCLFWRDLFYGSAAVGWDLLRFWRLCVGVCLGGVSGRIRL